MPSPRSAKGGSAEREPSPWGVRIKVCREQEGLTLQELASRSGVAPSTIQKVERGRMVPTVAVLVKIAKGLRRRVSYFLGDEDDPVEVHFLPLADRRQARAGNDVRVARLAGDLPVPDFDAFAVRIGPGRSSGRGREEHPGDKLVYCLRGRIHFEIGDRRFSLGPGDVLHFKSTIPHAWRNPDQSRDAEMLLVGGMGNRRRRGRGS